MKLDDNGFLVPDMDFLDYTVPEEVSDQQDEINQIKGLTENQAKWALLYAMCLISGGPFRHLNVMLITRPCTSGKEKDQKQFEQARLLAAQLVFKEGAEPLTQVFDQYKEKFECETTAASTSQQY